MSQRKPMSVLWAILAVRDDIVSAAHRLLLARMYLLDNGDRGCSATAELLSSYVGLTPRTVDDYRRDLADMGLAYRVPGTRRWHVNLPSGMPPDRGTVAEAQTYARRIEGVVGKPRSASGKSEHGKPDDGEGKTRSAGGENPIATYGKPDEKLENPDQHRASEHEGASLLLSTQETLEKDTQECSRSRDVETQENGNTGRPRGTADDIVADLTARLDAKRALVRGTA